jgi:hypothetical protein
LKKTSIDSKLIERKFKGNEIAEKPSATRSVAKVNAPSNI